MIPIIAPIMEVVRQLQSLPKRKAAHTSTSATATATATTVHTKNIPVEIKNSPPN